MEAFVNCTKLTTLSFEEGSNLNEIQGGAFGGCSKLNNVIIPEKVTAIAGSAFVGCSSLTSVQFETLNNWKYNGETLTLTNVSTNAIMLTQTHIQYQWIRSES